MSRDDPNYDSDSWWMARLKRAERIEEAARALLQPTTLVTWMDVCGDFADKCNALRAALSQPREPTPSPDAPRCPSTRSACPAQRAFPPPSARGAGGRARSAPSSGATPATRSSTSRQSRAPRAPHGRTASDPRRVHRVCLLHSERLVLSLCDHSGEWSKPYLDAGYRVERVDIKTDGRDVRLVERPERPVWGVLAAPPCTVFANSGARWARTPRRDARGPVSRRCLPANRRRLPATVVGAGEPHRQADALPGRADLDLPTVLVWRSLLEADAPVGGLHRADVAPRVPQRGVEDVGQVRWQVGADEGGKKRDARGFARAFFDANP